MNGSPVKEKLNIVQKLLVRWAEFSVARPFVISFFLFIMILAAAYYASGLKLRSDFQSMLPQTFQSVKDLEMYEKRIGGLDFLTVGIESSDREAVKKFSTALSEKVKERFKDRIVYINYNYKDSIDFYKRNALLFQSNEDILDIESRVKKYLGRKKLEAAGFGLDLDDDDEEEEKDSLPDVDEIVREEVRKWLINSSVSDDGFMINTEDNNLLGVIIKPYGFATSIDSNKQIIADIEAIGRELNPKSYAGDLKFGFAGPVAISIDEYRSLVRDIVSTAGLCVSLVLLIMFVYFLKVRIPFLIGYVLIAGISWTMALARWKIGYLNSQTAFLGAIIVGTSINYSIILIARYMEERKNGVTHGEAIRTSILMTIKATISAALTTAVAFFTLTFSLNESFSQFGFIASTGIMINWAAHLLFVPSGLTILEKIRPLVSGRAGKEIKFIPARLAGFILKKSSLVLVCFLVLAVAAVILLVKWIPDSLEYDFNKLRSKKSLKSGMAVLDERMSDVLHRSTTPAIILTDSMQQSSMLCVALEEKVRDNPEIYGYEVCKNIFEYMPEDQEKKLEVIKRLRAYVKKHLGFLKGEDRKTAIQFMKYLETEGIAPVDFPMALKYAYLEKDGRLGRMVYVHPVAGRNIWKYENLKVFVDTVREIELEGKTITSSGSHVIMYDLLQLVIHDAPRNTIYAIIGVFIILLLILRRPLHAAIILTSLVTGVLFLGGLMAILDVKLNFFNFIAIPTAFGTGADYGINIFTRYVEESGRNRNNIVELLKKTMVTTGGAVFLCSLTTIIGYGVLMLSNMQALASYGRLAISAEFACFLVAIIFIPALIILFKR